ncbi:hypothetical protein QTI99_16190 [Clostridium perfringens]|uniref:hypothetical protein n=1 Tax=Clostridium perfringens TaxID=1502 RepID=UPI002A1E549B|nr:hypothetical protein [Clostridium perfringens]MDM0904067.1 hypothetical protein [Clostridium perfringens]MDM0959098.1 hypothetical protein [Clostridium perfringens]MDM0998993.1 hypothetical protein [Clostridium perfringens]WVM77726.1 hypothetical protein V1680_16740 [Clostridium perfringens]
MKRRTFQVRLTEEDYEKIKNELGNINLSEVVRTYLLNLANGKTESEISKEKLIKILTEDEIIDFIYKKLKEKTDGKES